jgi:hypothetical protein
MTFHFSRLLIVFVNVFVIVHTIVVSETGETGLFGRSAKGSFKDRGESQKNYEKLLDQFATEKAQKFQNP